MTEETITSLNQRTKKYVSNDDLSVFLTQDSKQRGLNEENAFVNKIKELFSEAQEEANDNEASIRAPGTFSPISQVANTKFDLFDFILSEVSQFETQTTMFPQPILPH